MSPNSSIHSLARSPGSAEPLAATTFSDDVSYFCRVASSSSRIRFIITGTTTRWSARWRSICARQSSGSNLRVITKVVPSSIPIVKCAKPQE